jgi:hypothetical protein
MLPATGKASQAAKAADISGKGVCPPVACRSKTAFLPGSPQVISRCHLRDFPISPDLPEIYILSGSGIVFGVQQRS